MRIHFMGRWQMPGDTFFRARKPCVVPDDQVRARGPAASSAERNVLRSLATLGSLVLVGLLTIHSGLRFQLTGSLPQGIYRVVEGVPERGTVVMACLPSTVARLALDRRYVWPGGCPGGEAPIGKMILAVGGDTVQVGREGLSLNGRGVSGSQLVERDSRGRLLDHYPVGTHVLKPGQLWLFSPHHPLSFDSRYFGPIPESTVISRLVPLWTYGNAIAAAPIAIHR